jgi:hypothetical protein
VIETSTAKATHHGEATERAHPIRERTIREAAPMLRVHVSALSLNEKQTMRTDSFIRA